MPTGLRVRPRPSPVLHEEERLSFLSSVHFGLGEDVPEKLVMSYFPVEPRDYPAEGRFPSDGRVEALLNQAAGLR